MKHVMKGWLMFTALLSVTLLWPAVHGGVGIATSLGESDSPEASQTGGGSQSTNVPSGQAGNPSAHGGNATGGQVGKKATKTQSKSHAKKGGKKGKKGSKGNPSTSTPK